jgi:histidine phosphotransferase ChpT
MQPDAYTLAQAVCARLCHDLGGPVGALGGALELMDGAGSDALELAQDAARILDRRLRFWRAAAGGAPADLQPDALPALLEGLTLGRRARIATEGLARAPLPALIGQCLLLAAWAGVEALPRGGVLHIAGEAGGGLTLLPEGLGAAWPHGLVAALAGDPPEPEPRSIVVPLLMAASNRAGLRVEMLHGAAPGAPPVVLAPG